MSAKTNLILDLTIFTTFLAVANPALTGNTIHEWLSVAFAAAIITHLLLHWNWLVKVTTEFFKKFFHQSRLNYVVDALFFITLTLSIFSGLLISKNVLATLGIQLDVSRGWKSMHILASDTSLIMLGTHFALHWKWVISSIGRYIVTPIRVLFQQPDPKTLTIQPVRVEENK